MLFIYLFIRLFIYLIIYVFIYLFVYLFFEEQRISKKWVSGLIKVHIQMSYGDHDHVFVPSQLLLLRLLKAIM